MTELALRDISKNFDGTLAVDRISLTVTEGESVVLLGPSGCGKTTCLRLIAGFEQPDGGEIVYGDRKLAGRGVFVPPEKRDLAVVFQSYALWPHLTVEENVGYGPKVAKCTKADIHRRVHEALELVQLPGFRRRYPHQLSGGQQQRVALARALATRPKLLLLDEPLSNLDTRLREEMRTEVKRLRQLLGITMIYVTHDQAEALSLADRLVVMNKGQISQSGPPEEVYARPVDSYVARALGPTNIVTGQVRKADANSSCVRLFDELDVEVINIEDRCSSKSGNVSLSIRPCDVLLRAGDNGPVRATVAEAMFFGDAVQYSLALPGRTESLRATGPGASRYRPGDIVSLDVVPASVAVLADEPGDTRADVSAGISNEGAS